MGKLFNIYLLKCRFVIIFSYLLAVKFSLQAQDQLQKYNNENMIWLGYYNSISLKEHWKVNTDLQFRTKDWYVSPSQAILRSGINYKINETINISAGIAHSRYYISNIATRGELRPWQEIALQVLNNKIKFINRFRSEQRFIEGIEIDNGSGDYLFNWRFRFKSEFQWTLSKKIDFVIGNEFMLNAGKNITNNYFDQNRLYGGINAEFNKHFTFQIQYVYIWQLQTNGYTLNKINTIRLNLLHNINSK